MDDQQVYFEPSPGMYRFFEGIDDEDSGVEDLPFTNYVDLDGSNEACADIYGQSVDASTLFDHVEDELSFMDDDKIKDYKPKINNLSKRGHTKIAKRRQYSNTSVTENNILLMTPEKQILSQCDTDSNSSIRHYARKDRTPNTIKKMMERHRESERVRHHSLNESLKDVCMRVPGYDPGAKETKVIQMQRIIGYECFLENTFRALCEQLNVPSKLVLKYNNQFISDAMNTIPIEDFYQPSSYRTSDGDDEDEENDRLVAFPGRKNNISQRATKSVKIEDPRILKYRREKISSPTVDSTTDNIVRLGQFAYQDVDSTPRYLSQFDSHIYWNTEQTGFKTIDLSQQSSQESGIKVETQSSLDDDSHFHEINNFMEDELYSESEHLRTVTPSFMREETVSTSTCMDDTDEGFDLSSPVRYKDSVFLHSPPARGIWHSVSKHHLPDKADTPGHKEMESVSPENILETKPKLDSGLTEPSTSSVYKSSIRPMTEILSSTVNSLDLENMGIFQQVPECVPYPTELYTNTNHFTKVTPSSHHHSKSTISTCNKTEQFNVIGDRSRTSTPRSASSSAMQKGGKILKNIPVRNVKIQIVHASPSQRSLQSKLMDTRTVSSTSTGNGEHNISPLPPKLVHINQEQFSQPAENNKKENLNPQPEGPFAVTQLKRIPVPTMPTLQQLPGTVVSPLQYTTDLWSPEAKNKRKRYTPFRSPLLDRTNEDSDEENWLPEPKKIKISGQEGQAQKLQTRSTGIKPNAANIVEWPAIGSSETTYGKRKVDHRRSTWMNGFMMFSQLNRQKYISEHPGVHISVIQKLLGHKWRTMSPEEQLSYREKASQYSGLMKLAQTYPGSVVDSSTSMDTGTHNQTWEPVESQDKVDPSVITIAPKYWQF